MVAQAQHLGQQIKKEIILENQLCWFSFLVKFYTNVEILVKIVYNGYW